MLKPKHHWPNSLIGNSVLFVAQAMHELLDSQKNPSFRVKSLDLLGLLNEVMSVCEDVESAGVDRRNADAVIDEFIEVLRSDPVAKAVCNTEIDALRQIVGKMREKRYSLRDLIHHVKYFESKVAGIYQAKLEEYILENYRNWKNRQSVKAAISSYLSYLVNNGYSREFLLNRIEDRFFSKPVLKAETRTISRFFAEFSGQEKCFSVWAIASKSVTNFVRKLGDDWPEVFGLDAVPIDVSAWIKSQSVKEFQNPRILHLKIYAVDPYSAAHEFNDQMRRARALTALVQPHVIIHWSLTQYVRTPKATAGVTVSQFQSVLREFRLDAGGGGENKVRAQTKRINRFDIDSQERIYSSLANGKIAKDAMNGEQSIIATWSSFEILVRNPAPGIVRINHYKDALIPVLCLRYGRNYLRAVYLSIKRSDKKALTDALGKIECDHDSSMLKFALMMMLPEFNDLESDFFKEFSYSPLLQFHIWNLRRKFRAPTEYLSSLESHERRVSWQVERIYRSRNQIVHAGLSERYLESVARNANEYFRATVGPLIVRGKYGEGMDVDDVLAEFSLEYLAKKSRLRALRQNANFTSEQIAHYFQ